MSTPRLTFLYPFLFAPSRSSLASEASRTASRSFRTASRKSQSPATQRYGTANEPPAHLTAPKAIAAAPRSKEAAPKDAKALPRPPSKPRKTKDQKAAAEPESASAPAPSVGADGEDAAGNKEAASTASLADKIEAEAEAGVGAGDAVGAKKKLPPSPIMDATESHPSQSAPPSPLLPSQDPLETVLSMPSSETEGTASAPVYKEHVNDERTAQAASADPAGAKAGGKQQEEPIRPPHIGTPQYVHHFDTYGLVKRLEEGGWTQPQAVTIMKAVRLILADNMELAREGLVSKSNVENETYLFRAACSEMKTEIMTKRKAEAERSRTERAQLQHEVDILGQRLTQEGGNLKDELKGMFDDRKMAARNEQREMERKVQELNYQITISLNSDSRSDVEGVRWIITKRAITALAICVAMILGSIKFASNVAAWEDEEKKRLAALKASATAADNSPKRPKPGDAEDGGFVAQGEILVRQGDNPAFVSLG
ncbi:hypothetical protein MBLNU459_g3871t1 [Dothideomycetes sp. NU459]